MTISANYLPDFQRDQLLTAAIRLTGTLEQQATPTPEQYVQASIHMDNALMELQASGTVLYSAVRATLDLVLGQYEYDLPAGTLDVAVTSSDIIGMIVIEVDGTETAVRVMSSQDWMLITRKTGVSGRPSRCYVERHATVKIVLWPVPDASTYVFRYMQVKLLAANDTGAVTADVPRIFRPFLMYRIAAGVARDSSQREKAADLDGMANYYLTLCKTSDTEHGNLRFRCGHSGRN